MSEPMGVFATLLLSLVSAPAAPVDTGFLPGRALVPSLGLLAMGLWDILGPEDDTPVPEEQTADGGSADEDDFLGSGGFDDAVDGDDDGLDDLGDDDDVLADIEPRISSLEAEIESLSSTVQSVSGDHEAMRESVDSVEENVRKLLEVYEVVTQGANPFADADSAVGAGAFDMLGGSGEPAAADESLFEADEEPGDGEDGPDPADEETDEAAFEPADEDDGKTFEELKSEFELADNEAESGEDDPAAGPEDEQTAADEGDEEPSPSGSAEEAGKPYLTDLPDGYAGELLVMEWLNFLVETSSEAEAVRALRFYGTVGWITEDVAADLRTSLAGTDPDLATADGGRPSQLTLEHHARSLEFVSQLCDLDGATARPADGTLRGLEFGRGEHGIQR